MQCVWKRTYLQPRHRVLVFFSPSLRDVLCHGYSKILIFHELYELKTMQLRNSKAIANRYTKFLLIRACYELDTIQLRKLKSNSQEICFVSIAVLLPFESSVFFLVSSENSGATCPLSFSVMTNHWLGL